MLDLGDSCMYDVAPEGGLGTATTLSAPPESESDAERRVRELRELVLGVEEPAPRRRIGFL